MNRLQFTESWDKLSSAQKSMIISVGAILLATIVLFLGRLAFPDYDFKQEELIIITGVSGFIANTIKEFVKVK